ncbi:Xaa-Pro peptidase family protein [Halogeometricum sp. CBA1124]|uniref:M24 family metallopeptidase n=1 Tax=Halogeometricum sp. CBA1124 TaxID=2668071 RepID=UPI0018D2740B|nr:M24 family metallopeptidase [Halogeometricum sp. CBA1124]
MADSDIVAEKTNQAVETLGETDIDAWLTFARETHNLGEPCLPLVLGEGFVWPGMVLLTASGRKIAITETHDADNVRAHGVHEVYPYEESLQDVFAEVIADVAPDRVALNYSKSDPTADGLSYGLYRQLEAYFEAAGVDAEFVSAEPVVKRVRGSKSETETERIQAAVDTAQEILREVRSKWRPEWTEADTADFVHQCVADRGLETAWDSETCPAVTAGVEGEYGHAKPGGVTIPPGEVMRIDFGVIQDEYASDMQRVYYHQPEGETEIPAGLRSDFEDAKGAIEAGFDRLEPGVQGHEVDAAAREYLTERGWPEFQHGLGHQVGQFVHDGGTYLGPTWDRYGDAPYGRVREGEVYTLELGIQTDYGSISLEEMVQVTADGARFLTDQQTELWVLEAN